MADVERRHLRELAQADALQLIAEARSAARARVRAALEDALVDEMLAAVSEPAPPSVPEAAQSEQAWWAYCVVDSARAAKLAAGLSGIHPGSAVEALVEGDLAALLSPVPLAEYGDERLREHLEDISWLERTARAHEAVQETVMRDAPLVPLRLCTIYRDRERIRHVLRAHAGLFAENLAAVQGCAEWGVKVFLDLERGLDHPAPESSSVAEARRPTGAQYLADRQRERDQVRAADEDCARCAGEVHRAVAGVARADRANPVQRPEAHGREAEMILNAAFLVEHTRVEDLQHTVLALQDRWAPEGLLVELTGPWPPYNFVSDSAGMIS